jgi:hypothetical protein
MEPTLTSDAAVEYGTASSATQITLSDGRTAVIRKGKGRDAMKAQRVSGTDVAKFFPALMAELVTIDGSAMVMEDFEELDMQDYLKIQGELAGANFTSAAAT